MTSSLPTNIGKRTMNILSCTKDPIGYTVSKHDAQIITDWLNCAYPELITRLNDPLTLIN